jgi:NAD(P)-dependent dehydrogenase (short-subunit alcohol dehydrogenase family)
MASDWDLRGKTILITGAARGIGAESARRLATRGAKLALVGLEPEELERVAAQCGPDAAWFEADVTDRDALDRAVAGAIERFGGIDGVMANAGIGGLGLIRSLDPAAFERVVDVNLKGPFNTISACLPQLIERRGYALVVASMAVAAHMPASAGYSASKSGVEALTNVLREEVRHLGVDVGCAYFAFIGTDLVAGQDSHPLGFARASLPGPLAKTYPVSKVGEAVAEGFAKRKRRVLVPGWIAALLILRGLIQWLPAPKKAQEITRDMDERFQADVLERGAEAASAPVGAGGQAGSIRR